MAGLAKVLKIYGEMEVRDDKGESVTWVWDYAKDKPRLKSEMTKEEFTESEKSKWMGKTI